MVFVFGELHCFKRRRLRERMVCPHCGQYRTLESYSALEFIHWMFIPVIPMGRLRVVCACPNCRRCSKFALKGNKIKVAIQACFDQSTAQIGSDFAFVLEGVGSLAHLGAFEVVEELLAKLATVNAGMANIARARFLELQGLAEEAEACYRQAIANRELEGTPSFMLGRLLLHEEREEEAIAELQKAAQLNDVYQQYLNLLQDAMELRRRQKKWSGLSVIMAEIARLRPDLAKSKYFTSLYAKACKKSNRLPTMMASRVN